MRITRLFVLLLATVSCLTACAAEPDDPTGAWYEDVGVQSADPTSALMHAGPLPVAPPLDSEGVTQYVPVGHALIAVERNLLETRGAPEGDAVTRLGLIRVGTSVVGLDLLDWRRKDAVDLLRIERDLAGVIHLDPKQICDLSLREAILSASPEVLSLSFATGSRIPRKIPACLEALNGVALHLVVPAADGALVTALSKIAGLKTLILRAPDLDEAALKALGGAAGLRTLDLGAAQVGGEALAALQNLESLESLSLFGTLADDHSLEHLPNPHGLRTLDLGFTAVSDAGLARIADLVELRSLGLWHTSVTDDGLQSLRALEHLVSLDLAGTEVGDRGVVSLLGHAGLRRVDLTGTRVTDIALATLAVLPGLEVLRLGSTRVTDGGLLSLAAYPRLELLDLRGCEVSVSAVEALRLVRPEMDIRHSR
ncbi:MAG: hypothetical protein ABIK09_15910 [Pseudomonadota bacterium]